MQSLGLTDDILEILIQTRTLTNNTIPPKIKEEVNLEMQKQLTDINSENKRYYYAVANVMKQSLYLSNPACVESGLHGLGHMATFQSKIAVPIIDDFLKNPKTSNKHLIEYAHAARTGMIQ